MVYRNDEAAKKDSPGDYFLL